MANPTDHDEPVVLGVNVLGEPLSPCSFAPLTGFTRNGHCMAHPDDRGAHTICVRVTEPFLRFSLEVGNDLVTPRPEWRFPGLKAGDRWCVCLWRWLEALEAGVAPPVVLAATDQSVLEHVSLDLLLAHAWLE
ncbi:DUF2237 domain-containing protein [Hydrogenophilus islandicus]